METYADLLDYPKTLGELWDLGPGAAEALEAAERVASEMRRRELDWELLEERVDWLRGTLRNLQDLVDSASFQSERSPHRLRKLIQEELDDCRADY